MSGALVVFAKAPRPGLVKTRLCPPFSPEQAAAFYACLLDDVLAVSADAARRLALRPLLAVHPPDAVDELARRAPDEFELLVQQGAGLAERMSHVVSEVSARGHTPVLLRGSDSPILGVDVIGAALRALDDRDLAIAPDLDGGYGLVALGAPIPGLFDHAMSTATVLEDTLANARRAGATTRVLAAGFDVDTVADLERLADARRRGRAALCPRTIRWLDENAMWCTTPAD